MSENLQLFAENKDLIKLIIEAIERLEDASRELDEVRGIAKKLQLESKKYQEEILNLRKDKEALIQFIENNVTDEKALAEIFPKG